MRPGDHVLLLYESDADRDRLLCHFVELQIAKRNYVHCVSLSPNRQIKYFRKKRSLAAALNNNSLRIPYVSDVFDEGKPHHYFLKIIKEMQEMSKSKEYHGWILIGDWVRAYYERYMELLRTEQAEANLSHSGRIVCCYSAQGYSGIKTEILSKLLDLHTHVFFPRATFVRS